MTYSHTDYWSTICVFSGIDAAKEKLRNLAEGFRDHKIPFGNPVTAFRSGRDAPHPEKKASPIKPSVEDDRGYVDHLIDINEGYGEITQLIQQAGGDFNGLTADLKTATADLDRIGSNPNSSSPAAARNVSRRLAERIANFNTRLGDANGRYANISGGTEDSLEFLMTYQAQHVETTDPRIEEQKATLREFLVAAESARDSQLTLASQMDHVPRFERRLNRELLRGSQQVRTMANNIDRTMASINRALSASARDFLAKHTT